MIARANTLANLEILENEEEHSFHTKKSLAHVCVIVDVYIFRLCCHRAWFHDIMREWEKTFVFCCYFVMTVIFRDPFNYGKCCNRSLCIICHAKHDSSLGWQSILWKQATQFCRHFNLIRQLIFEFLCTAKGDTWQLILKENYPKIIIHNQLEFAFKNCCPISNWRKTFLLRSFEVFAKFVFLTAKFLNVHCPHLKCSVRAHISKWLEEAATVKVLNAVGID